MCSGHRKEWAEVGIKGQGELMGLKLSVYFH